MSDAMREAYEIGFHGVVLGSCVLELFVRLSYGFNSSSGSKGRGIFRSFSICVWSKAIDPATDAGMKIIVKAGLDWNIAQLYLQRNHGLGGNSWRN